MHKSSQWLNLECRVFIGSTYDRNTVTSFLGLSVCQISWTTLKNNALPINGIHLTEHHQEVTNMKILVYNSHLV